LITFVQVTHLELEQAHAALVQSHSEPVQTNVTTGDGEAAAAAVGEQRDILVTKTKKSLKIIGLCFVRIGTSIFRFKLN